MDRFAAHDRAQRERALQAWELVLLETPPPDLLEAMRKALRIKRFDFEAVVASLPGVVRRGAEVDLAPLLESLTQLGIRCELREAAARRGIAGDAKDS